jgi:3-isopropylmalate/(R)-2-methylmalate dehydratase large subunit
MRTLLDKVWEAHSVRTLPSGQTQLLIGLHLIHEVTTPQAFQMLKDAKLKVRMPERTFGTLDHIIPTTDQTRPYADPMAEDMAAHMYRNMKDFGLEPVRHDDEQAGHRPRHRGPSSTHPARHDHRVRRQPHRHARRGGRHRLRHRDHQVRDVLATQCLSMAKPLRQVRVDDAWPGGVYAKDVILVIINQLGVKGGVGYAYEYAGDVIARMTMEERLTLCNMSIEGGARFGYVNPDATTIAYLRGRPYSPAGEKFERAADWWKSTATEPSATFDDVKRIDGNALEPVVTWGINPEMSVGVSQRIPAPESAPEAERPTYREALAHMGFEAGQPIKGAKIDVAFVGSCTNGRLSDLRIAAEVAKKGKVAKHVPLIVPGSQQVAKAAGRGLHEVPGQASSGKAGRSMSRMNDDKLQGRDERVVGNRNFIGVRAARPAARTLDEPGHGRRRRNHRRRRRREGDSQVSTTTDFKRRQITGRGIPVTGNDIDTDRIIPARFLKAVTFEGMGEHAFEDARKQNPEHPFNSPAYKGASVLVVGQNFGCGSSAAAPQALAGYHAIGGSFGEIFFGNCVMLPARWHQADRRGCEGDRRSPRTPVQVDIEKRKSASASA